MVRGFYTAASGMVSEEKKLNVYAQNLANVSTAGYKRDGLVSGTFGEHMAVRMNRYQGSEAPQIGPSVYMTTITGEFTDYGQGGFEFTDNPMHAAIAGNGFFLIRRPEGDMALTRNGQFGLDEEGYLVLPGYGRVQGEGGDVQLGDHRFSITRDGMIYLAGEEGEEPEEIDRLMLVTPVNEESFVKNENEMFVAPDGYQQVDPESLDTTVLHKTVERSNVNVASEMSLILASQRSLQSCSQIVKMYDELADSVNTRISRVNR